MKSNSYVDWTTLTWRFEINFEKITIEFFENFFDFDDKMFIYTLICNTFNVKITSKICKLLKLLKNYNNYFDFKNAKIFFEHENEDHVIDLILDAKLLYKLFYILFETEFNILKNYLLKNLILNHIRKFTSRASASMLFVFKKNR